MQKMVVFVLLMILGVAFGQNQLRQGQISSYTLNFEKKLSQSGAKANQQSNYIIKSNMDPNSQMLIDLNLKIKVIPEGQSSQSKVSTLQQQNTQPFYCGKKMREWPSIFYDIQYVKKAQAAGLREMLVPTVYGFSMYVDAMDNFVSRDIWKTGTWSPDNINLIGHVVKPGDKILNLGSQTGIEAMVMGKIIGPQGKLYIFEPYSASNKLVTKNVRLNQLQNRTTIYKMGASNQKGTGTIQVRFENTGASVISSNPATITKQQGELEVVQLNKVDDVLPADISLDFALIDVEQMEIQALMGMRKVIQRSPNLFIMCQWLYFASKNKNKEMTLEMLRFLKEKGYRIFKYGNDDFNSCKLGKFYEFSNIESLLEVRQTDLYFMPSNHPMLPKQ